MKLADDPLNIVSVTTDYPGPRTPHRGLFVQRRLAALASMEKVHVLHLEPWFPWLRPWKQMNGQNGCTKQPPVAHCRMFYLPGVMKGMDSYWVKRIVLPKIRYLEESKSVDVIDAQFGYPDGVGCVKAALQLDRPVFITMRGLERPFLQMRDRASQLIWAFRQCTGIVCVSESLRQLAMEHGTAAEKICVIPNAVNRTLFCPGDQTEARRSLQLEQNCRLVVSVGMQVEGKGHHLLIEAFARLLAGNPDLRLAIIGGAAFEPAYPQQLKEQVAELGISDRVYLPGAQSPQQLVKWLRAADLFSLATFDEGCCNAILEAMACGLPVVTTPVGDNANLVDPPNRGILADVDNADSLYDSLKTALDRTWNKTQIADHGVDYSWDTVARRTAAFFRERINA